MPRSRRRRGAQRADERPERRLRGRERSEPFGGVVERRRARGRDQEPRRDELAQQRARALRVDRERLRQRARQRVDRAAAARALQRVRHRRGGGDGDAAVLRPFARREHFALVEQREPRALTAQCRRRRHDEIAALVQRALGERVDRADQPFVVHVGVRDARAHVVDVRLVRAERHRADRREDAERRGARRHANRVREQPRRGALVERLAAQHALDDRPQAGARDQDRRAEHRVAAQQRRDPLAPVRRAEQRERALRRPGGHAAERQVVDDRERHPLCRRGGTRALRWRDHSYTPPYRGESP